MDEELVVESITYHFAVGNAELDTTQFGQHLASGVCPQCADVSPEGLLSLVREEATV